MNFGIKAAFIQDMANKRRYPHWAVGLTPPPGVITTPIGAIQLVNVRRQIATTGMHTIASILDDLASDHSTTADSHLQGLKKHYAQQPPNTDGPVYRLDSVIDLSRRLVERASAGLNKRLFDESTRLKACPEAALWVGIPISLVPANIKAFNQQSPALPPTTTQAPRNHPHPTDTAPSHYPLECESGQCHNHV